MFDILQIVFWSISYILFIVFGIWKKKTAEPPIAIAFNFSWEVGGCIKGFINNEKIVIGRLVWAILDIGVLVIYLFICKPAYFKSKILFLIPAIIAPIFVATMFLCVDNGMLISSFIIDLIMAIDFVMYAYKGENKYNQLAIAFCITKLLGDLFAWIYYTKCGTHIFIIGLIVFILNIICLAFAFKKTYEDEGQQTYGNQ